MIKQIKYFQAVVRCQSFSKAADDCFISQSAISQQIQALENELGVKLFDRSRRKISLTPVGEFFYRKSLVLVSDFDRLMCETRNLAQGVAQNLTIGYLRHYEGKELNEALAEFNAKFPDVSIKFLTGTHEELYEFLREGKADVVFSDLRRKPSELYVNFFLALGYFFAELPLTNPLAQLETISPEDLKSTPLIIISPPNQAQVEEIFYREYLGLRGDFLLAENLQEAHLLAASNKGLFAAEFFSTPPESKIFRYVPLIFNGAQLFRKYYAFWRANSTKNYIEEFAALLKNKFPTG